MPSQCPLDYNPTRLVLGPKTGGEFMRPTRKTALNTAIALVEKLIAKDIDTEEFIRLAEGLPEPELKALCKLLFALVGNGTRGAGGIETS